ncbi:MAG: pilus assembly protein PilP [Deltaproteobacteria bacterium]|nr:pilus assembly protein PilP [Deltaproteobacteria bacterium]
MTATVFCLMALYSGFGNSRDALAAVRHVSRRIKIVRPSAMAEKTKAAPVSGKVAKTEKTVGKTPASKTAVAGPPEKAVSSVGALPVALAPESLFKGEQHLYSRKGRIDPFAPFLHKPEPQITGEGPVKLSGRVPMTPLERIAIGQLTLTAVLRLSDKSIALVQESSGKGYIVKLGTYIGENGGRVSNIEKNLVVIEEKSKNIFGKTETKKIELKLKKQPGE